MKELQQTRGNLLTDVYSLQDPGPNDAVRAIVTDSRWHSVGSEPDHEIAASIARDKVDILLNLNGNTEGGRNLVSALRAAPVQAVFLGPHDSLAMDTVPYFVSDGITTPAGLQPALFTERLGLLPYSFHPSSHKVTRAAPTLPTPH